MIVQVCALNQLKQFNINYIVTAIGVFDGIHLGHRKIIEELLIMAKKFNASPVIITFYPHPRQVLQHEKNIHFLRSQNEKAAIFEELGIKAIVTLPFTEEFAALTPEQFIESITSVVALKGICVGKHWRFGSGGTGSRTSLEKLATKKGFAFSAVEEVRLKNIRVSSSAIRNAIASNNIKLAEEMLGAPLSYHVVQSGSIHNSHT